MNRIIKIGMDVHSTNFTLCALEPKIDGEDRIFDNIRVDPDYKYVLRFIEKLKERLGSSDNYSIECGYEAGCLGYSLYRQLTKAGVKCVILAPTTMLSQKGKRVKTDARDAAMIAQCLAYNGYRAVHVPTEKDNGIKEYLRMRDDHKIALKKLKQQINAFCLRNGQQYSSNKWTISHLTWLRKLELPELYRETLNEYLATYDEETAKIERFDRRIEELASDTDYKDHVRDLGALLGIKTHTALSLIVETGDFKRFAKGNTYAAFLGLAPGESSSGEHICRTGISKAGNAHLRTLLIEASRGICKGKVGYKSKALRARQAECSAEIIAYADRANARLRSKYYRLIRHDKKKNIAVAAIARELACFIWGIMTDHTEMKTNGQKTA